MSGLCRIDLLPVRLLDETAMVVESTGRPKRFGSNQFRTRCGVTVERMTKARNSRRHLLLEGQIQFLYFAPVSFATRAPLHENRNGRGGEGGERKRRVKDREGWNEVEVAKGLLTIFHSPK